MLFIKLLWKDLLYKWLTFCIYQMRLSKATKIEEFIISSQSQNYSEHNDIKLQETSISSEETQRKQVSSVSVWINKLKNDWFLLKKHNMLLFKQRAACAVTKTFQSLNTSHTSQARNNTFPHCDHPDWSQNMKNI